jgi:hypothetical protein
MRACFAAGLVAALALPPSAPRAAEVLEGCDPHALAVMVSSPPAKAVAIVSDLDRRIAATIAAQRALGELPPARRDGVVFAVLAVALLAGLAILPMDRWWRRTGFALAAALLVALGALQTARRHQRQVAHLGRAADLADCRLRLVETRALIEHSRLARCVADLEEADEDMRAWQAKLKSGGVVGLEEVTHTHEEIAHRTP